jgi:DNA polymerase I-like protein with 3'-5' exonuclease and polymerase domains
LLYASLYGAGATKVGGGDKEKGQVLLDSMERGQPSLPALKERAIQYCESTGGVIYTEFGRRLYYPHICYENALEDASKLTEDEREGQTPKAYAKGLQARAKRQVFNAVLQGTAADILKILSVGLNELGVSVFDLEGRVQPFTGSSTLVHHYGGVVAADVHDESLFYVPTEYAPACASELTVLFGTPLLLGCPIAGEAKVGNSWAEVH